MRRRNASSTSSRLQIRRKNNELVERDLDPLAVGKVEVIAVLFQRQNPAVQQLVDLHPLAAEVVDHQRAAIALHLQRRLADAGRRVQRHLQRGQGQFAADDHRRPADADPTLVDHSPVVDAAARLQGQLLVARRIEQPNHVPVDADRPRNPDVLAEGPRHPLGDARLPVAGRAEEEQPAAGVDRRTEAVEHLPAQQQVGERRFQAFGLGVLSGEGLRGDAGRIIAERDGRAQSRCTGRNAAVRARGPRR